MKRHQWKENNAPMRPDWTALYLHSFENKKRWEYKDSILKKTILHGRAGLITAYAFISLIIYQQSFLHYEAKQTTQISIELSFNSSVYLRSVETVDELFKINLA